MKISSRLDLGHWYYREPVELDPPTFFSSASSLLRAQHIYPQGLAGSSETGLSGNSIAERERSDVVHDLLAYLQSGCWR